MKKILLEKPEIILYEDIFSNEECRSLIEIGRENLKDAAIVNSKGEIVADHSIITSKFSKSLNDAHRESMLNLVRDKLEKTTGIASNRLEPNVIGYYGVGDEFKLHQDYFMYREDPDYVSFCNERAKNGGNRVITAVIYLNNVEEGGETYFPWDDIKIKPKAGSLVLFRYDYDDPHANLRSQHLAMPVIKGEKWIITAWYREKSYDTEVVEYKSFKEESILFDSAKDTTFELECGPMYDRRMLKITLPANHHPMNTIFVGFTSGMDSILLLYLVGALNSLQPIPYHIVPFVVTTVLTGNNLISENHAAAQEAIDLIRSKIDGRIKKRLYVVPTNVTTSNNDALKDGGLQCFDPVKYWHPDWKFRKPVMIYSGTTELPTAIDDERFSNISWKRNMDQTEKISKPFLNLKKIHVVDSLLQLGLEDLIAVSDKCTINHSSLSEKCIHFACNERRWAFQALDLIEMGNKYFINLYNGGKND